MSTFHIGGAHVPHISRCATLGRPGHRLVLNSQRAPTGLIPDIPVWLALYHRRPERRKKEWRAASDRAAITTYGLTLTTTDRIKFKVL